jgi:subtilisin family serine protease
LTVRGDFAGGNDVTQPRPAQLAALLVSIFAIAAAVVPSADAGVLSPRLLRAERALRAAAGEPAEASALPPLAEVAITNRAKGGVLPAAGEEARLSLVILTDDPEALRAAGFELRTVAGEVVTVTVPLSRLHDLETVRGVRWAELSRPLTPKLNVSLSEINGVAAHGATQPPYPASNATGRNVVVGVVDSGIDLAHPDFRNDDGTSRVEWVWDQNDALGPTPGGVYDYGTAWNSATIDAGTTRQQDTYGHGTHVAGIAAGNGRAYGGTVAQYTFVGVAPEADLVIVNTDFTTGSVIDAVQWIEERAAAMGRPSVVNLSLGSQFGSHDGTEALDVAFRALSGPGKIIVASAGNEGDAGIHAEASVPAGGFLNIQFTIGPYTATPGNTGAQQDVLIVESWYPGPRTLTFQVTTPRGYTSNTVGLGVEATKSTNDGTIWVGVVKAPQNNDNTCEIDLWDGSATFPPYAGTWTVRVNNPGVTEVPIDFWIPYDALGNVGAGTYWSTYGVERETVGSPASSDSVIAVAAYVTKASWPYGTSSSCGYNPPPPLGSLASFSSRGPRRDGAQKPDIAAPGMGIASAWSANGDPYFYDNVACAKTNDGFHVVSQGTSQSSPHIAGVAALILEKHPTDACRQVLARMQNSARVDGWTGAVPNASFGEGKVNAQAAINASTPVRVLAMSAAWTGGAATVSWTVAEAQSGTRFLVERGESEDGAFLAVSDLLDGGPSFAWTDPSPDPEAPWYRVLAFAPDGAREVLGTVRLDGLRTVLRLGQNAPNPFTASTRLEFSLDRAREVRVEVLDVAGRRVTTLATGLFAAGPHALDWDGRDAQGRPAAAGIYFCRLRADDTTLTRRMVLKR